MVGVNTSATPSSSNLLRSGSGIIPPIALALDAGAAQRQALGVVVIGGLISSLLLTLVLVPVMFMWLGPKPHAESAAATSPREPVYSGAGA